MNLQKTHKQKSKRAQKKASLVTFQKENRQLKTKKKIISTMMMTNLSLTAFMFPIAIKSTASRIAMTIWEPSKSS